MPPTVEEQFFPVWIVGVFAASVGAWFFLTTLFFQRGAVLPYEPRRPVPWSVWATLLAVVHVVGGFASSAVVKSESAKNGMDIESTLALGIFSTFMFVIVFLIAVAIISEATRADLGLPASLRQMARDILVGAVCCLAAYGPVMAVGALMLQLFGRPEWHPMIQDVLKNPNSIVFALAFVSAVVVAPIVEELIFRLLLQGWLEKWEDRMLGWRWVESPPGDPTLPQPDPLETLVEAKPPVAGVGFMPYGSLPILVSSVMFASAHIGHSTDPFPLLVLSLFLGFVYQRTHRIVPCIIAHAIFNFISMLALWQILFSK